MENDQNDNLMTFGEHLEVFRKMLFRVIGITVCLAVIIFCAKDVPASKGGKKYSSKYKDRKSGV